MSSPVPVLSPRALRAAGPFVALGVLLVAIGALSWATHSWALRIGGVLAIAVGGYVLLSGLGLFRVRREQRRAAAEQELDAAVLATAAQAAVTQASCATGTACATCDTACALRH